MEGDGCHPQRPPTSWNLDKARDRKRSERQMVPDSWHKPRPACCRHTSRLIRILGNVVQVVFLLDSDVERRVDVHDVLIAGAEKRPFPAFPHKIGRNSRIPHGIEGVRDEIVSGPVHYSVQGIVNLPQSTFVRIPGGRQPNLLNRKEFYSGFIFPKDLMFSRSRSYWIVLTSFHFDANNGSIAFVVNIFCIRRIA